MDKKGGYAVWQRIPVGVTPTLITFKVPTGTEGIKDVVVTNPDGQKGILRSAYIYNPFPVIDKIRASYGGPLSGGTEIIITGSNFMAGLPIDVVYGEGTNEIRWQNPSLRRGIYVYVMEVVMQNGKKGAYRGVLEVYE